MILSAKKIYILRGKNILNYLRQKYWTFILSINKTNPSVYYYKTNKQAFSVFRKKRKKNKPFFLLLFLLF